MPDKINGGVWLKPDCSLRRPLAVSRSPVSSMLEKQELSSRLRQMSPQHPSMGKEHYSSTKSPRTGMEGPREDHELKQLMVNKLERSKSFQNMKSWTKVRQTRPPPLGLKCPTRMLEE